jgi:hypothetical protein
MGPLAFSAAPTILEFSASPDSTVAPDRTALYEAARSLERACPSFSFIDCARHAERALQNRR